MTRGASRGREAGAPPIGRAARRKFREAPALREVLVQYGRLLVLVRPYWSLLARGMLLGLVSGLVAMATPYVTKLLIDEVFPSRDATLMHVLVAGLLSVATAVAIMDAIRGYFQIHVNARLTNASALLFFNHLQHLPARFFDKHRVGEVMSRFADVRQSLATVSNALGTAFVQGAYILLVPPFLLLLNWRLAAVALAFAPLTIGITLMSARTLRTYFKRTAEAYADLSAYQTEVLSHIRTLKVHAMEHEVFSRANEHVKLALRQHVHSGLVRHAFSLATACVGAAGTAVFTWYGWTLILDQRLTLGTYVAFTAYLAYFTRPLTQFTLMFGQMQQSAVNLGRMFEYLDEDPEQDPSSAYLKPAGIAHRLSGEIELRDVSFGYTAESRTLDEVSLVLRPGELTALIGPSGVGKSSLLRLICRLEDPDSGVVLFGGVPAPDIALRDLRRQIAVAWQDAGLMNGTIWDNLTCGATSVTRPEVDDVVQLCRLDGLLADLRLGYGTQVAEWGASLSAGQRQRVALARALIRRTPVLLMDEATSNVDERTEAEILEDLFADRDDRIILFVTHRLGVTEAADQICVLDGGRVVGMGRHEELLHRCEPYRKARREHPDDAAVLSR